MTLFMWRDDEQAKPAGDIQQEPQKPPSSASGQFYRIF
jgi:hypothetical protein